MRFDNQAAVPIMPVERSSPVREASLEQNVKVPLAFALVMGLVAAGLLCCLYLYLYDKSGGYEPFSAYLIPSAGLVVFGLAFILQFVSSWRILWAIERVVGDLDGDGFRGDPVVHEYSIQVEQPDGLGRVLINFTLPDGVTHEMFKELMRGILNGYGTSTHTWCGSGHLFSRPKFDALKSILIARGLACLLTPGQPNSKWALTSEGEELARRVVGND